MACRVLGADAGRYPGEDADGDATGVGGGEAGNGGADETWAFVLREGYRVRRGKEMWADELFAACRRLRLGTDYRGRPHLRLLSERATLRSRNTLQSALQTEGYPEIATLLLLEEHVGVPVVRSLLALGVLTLARLEADLGISAPQVRAEAVEAPALANLNAALPILPREALARLFDALLELRGLNPGNSHGPSPTAADRS